MNKKDLNQLGTIQKVNFYKESTQLGMYYLIGSKVVSLQSDWADPQSNSQQKAWRYRVTTVDTCGNESAPSNSHKTIHLAINLGLNGKINLSWDHYTGFSFGTY